MHNPQQLLLYVEDEPTMAVHKYGLFRGVWSGRVCVKLVYHRDILGVTWVFSTKIRMGHCRIIYRGSERAIVNGQCSKSSALYSVQVEMLTVGIFQNRAYAVFGEFQKDKVCFKHASPYYTLQQLTMRDPQRKLAWVTVALFFVQQDSWT